ncbi:uncharacterized protein LOC122516471 isoform X2 [Polistes fuscatus]|uniref:uncharacterized protein LOC122516471 isoform X2 n=1 Tax=Polistes fuscatus TaxID=30207 RepID=UPI001CA93ACC|nr:uncharacterized protein LOC122516471 isoform X2 [Polistes fuscatus]
MSSIHINGTKLKDCDNKTNTKTLTSMNSKVLSLVSICHVASITALSTFDYLNYKSTFDLSYKARFFFKNVFLVRLRISIDQVLKNTRLKKKEATVTTALSILQTHFPAIRPVEMREWEALISDDLYYNIIYYSTIIKI